MRKLKAIVILCGLLAAATVLAQQGTPPGAYGSGATSVAPNTPNTTNVGVGNAYYTQNYGVKADSYVVYDAVCTNGLPQITSATAHFKTKAKIAVGQIVWAIPGGGLGNNPTAIPKTTIKSVDSDTQITANANGNAGCTSGMALVWGDDDTAALNAMWASVTSPTNCGGVYLPAGNMMINGGVMNTPLPTICLAQLQDNSVSIQGAGWQTTDFFPTPDFDLTTCTGGGKTSCIGPGDIMLRDFQFIGFGLASTTVSTTTATIFTALTPAMLLNISCQQFAVNDANLTGFTISSSLFYMSNVQSSNCGALGPSFGAGASAGSVFASYFVPIGGSMTVTAATPGPDFYTTWIAPSSVNECASNISGFANFFGLAGQIGGSGSEMCVAGGTVTFHGSHLFHNQGIAGRAALKITAGGTATAANSSFSDAGAGEFSVSVDATSTFVDGCGNTYTGAVNVSVGGKFIPCPSTVYPSGSVLQLVGATGTGACATITTIKGHIFSGSLTCTGSTGASTIVLTPGQTAVNGWRCSADDMTTNTNLPHQSANNQTTCTLTVASVSANDVITFQLAQF